MARRQVKCIKSKTGAPRHEYITHIGGDWGWNNSRIVIPESEAIKDIDYSINSYFVRDSRGDEANVKVITHSNGRRFLTTVADYTTFDNLAIFILKVGEKVMYVIKSVFHLSYLIGQR